MPLSSGAPQKGHGVYKCHACGWQFPNHHPSAKQRRAHKKHCPNGQGHGSIGGSGEISDESNRGRPVSSVAVELGSSGGVGGEGEVGYSGDPRTSEDTIAGKTVKVADAPTVGDEFKILNDSTMPKLEDNLRPYDASDIDSSRKEVYSNANGESLLSNNSNPLVAESILDEKSLGDVLVCKIDQDTKAHLECKDAAAFDKKMSEGGANSVQNYTVTSIQNAFTFDVSDGKSVAKTEKVNGNIGLQVADIESTSRLCSTLTDPSQMNMTENETRKIHSESINNTDSTGFSFPNHFTSKPLVLDTENLNSCNMKKTEVVNEQQETINAESGRSGGIKIESNRLVGIINRDAQEDTLENEKKFRENVASKDGLPSTFECQSQASDDILKQGMEESAAVENSSTFEVNCENDQRLDTSNISVSVNSGKLDEQHGSMKTSNIDNVQMKRAYTAQEDTGTINVQVLAPSDYAVADAFEGNNMSSDVRQRINVTEATADSCAVCDNDILENCQKGGGCSSQHNMEIKQGLSSDDEKHKAYETEVSEVKSNLQLTEAIVGIKLESEENNTVVSDLENDPSEFLSIDNDFEVASLSEVEDGIAKTDSQTVDNKHLCSDFTPKQNGEDALSFPDSEPPFDEQIDALWSMQSILPELDAPENPSYNVDLQGLDNLGGANVIAPKQSDSAALSVISASIDSVSGAGNFSEPRQAGREDMQNTQQPKENHATDNAPTLCAEPWVDNTNGFETPLSKKVIKSQKEPVPSEIESEQKLKHSQYQMVKNNGEISETPTSHSSRKLRTPLKRLLETSVEAQQLISQPDGLSQTHKQRNPRTSSLASGQPTVRGEVQKEWNSPARLPQRSKNSKAKGKGKPQWVPFMCCPSVT